ncbi:MAG: Uma2 family endonuclease [Bacteroidota bacterium]
MAEQKIDRPYTVEEYLAMELAEPEAKYEYVDGVLYNMTGGTIQHGLLISNALYWIKAGIREKGLPCKTFGGDVKVLVEEANAYLYPDVFVVCGKIDDRKHPNQAIRNPKLIVEVLSKSTQGYDHSQKFRLYRSNPDFEEYVMIDQEKALIESYYRISEDHWQISTIIGLDKSLELRSLELAIAMKDLYEDVLSQ